MEDKNLEWLVEFLRIPSISSDPKYKKEMLIAYEFLKEEFSRLKFDVQKLSLGEANPVLYASLENNPDYPTVLCYFHYDVQPSPDDWVIGSNTINPFNPLMIGDRIYGRGTADDKGQLAAYIFALRQLQLSNLKCNIKFLIEGDEENSKSLIEEIIDKNKDLLGADVVLISDTTNPRMGHPSICTSLRGMVPLKINPDSPETLIDIIHSSHDPNENKILIPHFYDSVLPPNITEEMQKTFGGLGGELGIILKPERGYSALEHIWGCPSTSPTSVLYANKNPVRMDNIKTIKITAYGPKGGEHSGGRGGPVPEPGIILSHILAMLKERGKKYCIDYIKYGEPEFAGKIHEKGKAQISFSASSDIEEAIGKINEKYGFGIDTEKVTEREKYLESDFKKTFGEGDPMAYLTYRLVANQDPDNIYSLIDQFIQGIPGKTGIEKLTLVKPFVADIEGGSGGKYASILKRALENAFENTVDEVCEGGSIPITELLQSCLKAPVLVAGLARSDAKVHGDGENIHYSDICAGTKAIYEFFTNFN